MRISALFLISSLLTLTSCGGGGGNSSTTTPTTPVNNAPIVSSANADQAAQVGFAFNYDATQNGQTFSDADNDTLNISASFAPDTGVFTENNGAITGTPVDTGDVTVTLTASDGTAGITDTFIISVTADQDSVQAQFGANIDLNNLLSYENPTVPDYIRNANTVPNPVSDKGATLGRIIFYDRALSVDGTVACANCHQQANAFTDTGVVSPGVQGGMTGRHSMRLANNLYARETDFFWDERANGLEDQVTQPFRDHGEHGFSGQGGRPDFDDMITIMEGLDYYPELFRFVFLDEDITEARIQSALAQFVLSITSFDSKFDEGRAQVANNGANFPNFTAEENAGKNLFLNNGNNNGGGAGCGRCHGAPEFDIAPNSNQNGVVGVAGDPNAFDFTNERAPTLRDLVKPDGSSNGPLMHDGSLTTLRDAINHYDNIPVPTGEPERTQFLNSLDNRLTVGGGLPRQLNLSETEKDQLVAFLRTLSGEDIYTEEKWSNPF